jgi:hypothetical protein
LGKPERDPTGAGTRTSAGALAEEIRLALADRDHVEVPSAEIRRVLVATLRVRGLWPALIRYELGRHATARAVGGYLTGLRKNNT